METAYWRERSAQSGCRGKFLEEKIEFIGFYFGVKDMLHVNFVFGLLCAGFS